MNKNKLFKGTVIVEQHDINGWVDGHLWIGEKVTPDQFKVDKSKTGAEKCVFIMCYDKNDKRLGEVRWFEHHFSKDEFLT